MSKKPNSISKNESGLVSFLVVMVIMIVLSLIVMSYSRIVRKEQLQTVDRQLNTQALYAAESAVNDAMEAINSNPLLLNSEYDKCEGSGSFVDAAGLTSDRNLGDGVSYSCLLVDTSPLQLEFPGVNTQKSTTTILRGEGGTPITRLEISWDSESAGATNVSGCLTPAGRFPSSLSANCEIGALRFELVPFNGAVDRASMIDNRAIGILQPSGTSGFDNRAMGQFVGAYNQGLPFQVRCTGSGPRYCSFTITGMSIQSGYLNLRSIYRNTPVTIRAFNGSNRIGLIDSQVVVDVTGSASGVVKRIQQHRQIKPTNDKGVASDFALQSTKTICKRFIYWPGAASPALGGVPAGPNDSDYCDPLEN